MAAMMAAPQCKAIRQAGTKLVDAFPLSRDAGPTTGELCQMSTGEAEPTIRTCGSFAWLASSDGWSVGCLVRLWGGNPSVTFTQSPADSL